MVFASLKRVAQSFIKIFFPLNIPARHSTGNEQERLIVFTRYPTPGKTKTRLIPALGPGGAAELQRRMTEHVIGRVRTFARERHVPIEVRYDGSSRRDMKHWLGRELRYRRQSAGDVGMRMANAFREAFEEGAKRAVLMGTDCPGITSQIIHDAFDGLDEDDIVLGPANDGGYYLIGLRRHVEELFVGVPWGTDEVMKGTVHIAKERGRSVHLLKPLADVDTPEDLPVWENEERLRRKQTHAERISIIIPALNESSSLRETLRIQNARDTEIIVVDGGSSDNTVETAESYDAKVIVTSAGRAKQMNAGAAAATGDILLFLHADTHLPDKFDEHVRRILTSPETVGGAFRLSIDASKPGLRFIERLANWRAKALQMPYGDQALFLKASFFREMDGFPDVPIMEDFVFVRRLRKRGRIAIAPIPVTTSARRWLSLGVWRTTLINQGIIAAYYAGVPLKTIAGWYHGRSR